MEVAGAERLPGRQPVANGPNKRDVPCPSCASVSTTDSAAKQSQPCCRVPCATAVWPRRWVYAQGHHTKKNGGNSKKLRSVYAKIEQNSDSDSLPLPTPPPRQNPTRPSDGPFCCQRARAPCSKDFRKDHSTPYGTPLRHPFLHLFCKTGLGENLLGFPLGRLPC